MSEKIEVSLSPDRLSVAPGASATATASIKNAGDVVEAYTITIEGIDSQWYTLSASTISLFPGDQEQVELTVHPPKASGSTGGSHSAAIKVASNRDPTAVTTVSFTVELGRFLVFDIDIGPKKAKGRKGTYTITIHNGGNVPTTYTFAGKDAEDLCRFDFKPASVTVQPGATTEVPVVVDPKKKPFTGKSRMYNFKVTVTSHASKAGETKTLEAQLECTPLIPVWALIVAGVGVVAIAAVLIVFLVVLAGHAPIIDSVTADSETVGVGGTSTITCDASDADGDTLSYLWATTGGTISGTGDVVTWTAPSTAGDYTVSVTVEDGTGRTAESSLVLTAVITTGSIEIDSSPAGAAIYLDGEDIGTITPYTIADVEEGDHTVRLTADFHKNREETVTVVAGETTYVNWELDPAPPQAFVAQPGPANANDSFVAEHSPDTPAQGTPPFDQALAVAGNTASTDARSYLQFDLSTVPSTAVVTSASLKLFHGASDPSAVNGPVGAYAVTGSWTEDALTWNTQPSSVDAPVDTIAVTAPAPSAFVSWDITDLVQDWVDGSVDNHGVMLADTDESSSDGWKWFYSADWGTAPQRPKLEIEYWDPVP
ncbi:MAG: DNRLRE domain-containing protein [Chloroflexota bacterium]